MAQKTGAPQLEDKPLQPAGTDAAAPDLKEKPRQLAGTDAAAPEDDSEDVKINLLQWSRYFFTLFAAYWCGTSRFSKVKHPEDDFDPENVQHYLKNKTGHKDDKKFLHGNFRRVDHKALKRQEARRKARAEKAAAGEEIVEEDEIYENLFVKQIPPYFVVFECLVVVAFWVIGAAVYSGPGSEMSFLSRKGGMDTFAESSYGATDLRWSNLDCEDLRSEIWRWLTYQFTHVGVKHVLMNVLLIVIMGLPLEGVHGSLRMLAMFNVGVFGGAMAFFLLNGHGAVVGCSGGCYALIGIHFADLLVNWDSKKFKYPTLAMLLVLVAIDVGSALINPSEGTSHSAHVGGAVFGLIIGVIVCKDLVVERYERIIEVVMAIIGVGLLIFAFSWLGTQDEGPKNIFQAGPGYCSAFAYRDILPGEEQPRVMCSYCGTQDCLEALRHRYKTCCAPGQANCFSEPYYCVSPFAVNKDYCTKYRAVWLQ